MTLLTIIQDGLQECGDCPIPGSVVNNPDETASKALAIVKGLGRDLSRQYKWPSLKDTYTFQTAPNVAQYALPADFQRMVPLTQWDRTSRFPLNGVATDVQWQAIQSGLVVMGLRMWFRLQGTKFAIAPTPADVRTIAYDYFKNTWVSSAAGAPQVTFLADTDIPVFMPNGNGEDCLRLGLIYKWKASSGLPYQDDKANYLSAIDADAWDSNDLPMMDVSGTGQFISSRGNLPETGFGL